MSNECLCVALETHLKVQVRVGAGLPTTRQARRTSSPHTAICSMNVNGRLSQVQSTSNNSLEPTFPFSLYFHHLPKIL